MRRLLAVALLAACARATPVSSAIPAAPTADAPGRVALFSSPNLPTVYKDAPVATTTSFAKPPDQVAAAARLAFVNIGVPVLVDDPAGARIGNVDFYRSRTFAGKNMAELVNCGSSMTGPNAMSFRIYMSLVTTVAPDARGGSNVRVVFLASGRDVVGGASNDRVQCDTTGGLEQLLLGKIQSYLVK